MSTESSYSYSEVLELAELNRTLDLTPQEVEKEYQDLLWGQQLHRNGGVLMQEAAVRCSQTLDEAAVCRARR